MQNADNPVNELQRLHNLFLAMHSLSKEEWDELPVSKTQAWIPREEVGDIIHHLDEIYFTILNHKEAPCEEEIPF